MRERFELDENMKSPDIDIYDRRNRQGVHVVGIAESLAALKTLLLKHLTDVIFRRQPFPIDGIYKGIIKKDANREHFVSVDLGSMVGRLQRNEIDRDELDSGVIVQIQRRRTLANNPVLTTKINIPGKYAVLISEEKIKASLKIRDWQKRMGLIELGKKLASSDWGIIWRTTAADQSKEVLEREVHGLAKKREEILRKAKEKKAPTLLVGDRYYMNVEFPALSKASLDSIRAKVTPTIKGHHYYKACGKAASAALEMAEKMLQDKTVYEKINQLFHATVDPSFPVEGSLIAIVHVKPDGKVLHLGKAWIEKFSKDKLRYSRVFRNEGIYDGLGTSKEPEDRAVTEAKIGDWHYITRYFSKDGAYKGALVNLHTPLELYPRWIRYVDLEIDICVLPDGTIKVVDEDELEKAIADNFVSEKLAAITKEKLSIIMENLQNNFVFED
jgi:Ribonuclease G/E